jgi:release factor glutamine methyltransferase
MISIGKVIKTFKNSLQEIYPHTEIQAISELVLQHLFGYSKTDTVIKAEEQILPEEYDKFQKIIDRLKKHEPIQYILGYSWFYSYKILVNKYVLIPRPETEELVDWVIKDNIQEDKPAIFDMATGSGCIAIALARHMKGSRVFACDISAGALKIARENANMNQADIVFIQKDILKNEKEPANTIFDIIVSNPPYVLKGEKEKMQRNVLEFEPGLALFVENDNPLLFYQAILNYAHHFLKTGGKLYFEINEAYGQQLVSILKAKGYEGVVLRKDINGKDRMIRGIKGNGNKNDG